MRIWSALFSSLGLGVDRVGGVGHGGRFWHGSRTSVVFWCPLLVGVTHKEGIWQFFVKKKLAAPKQRPTLVSNLHLLAKNKSSAEWLQLNLSPRVTFWQSLSEFNEKDERFSFSGQSKEFENASILFERKEDKIQVVLTLTRNS